MEGFDLPQSNCVVIDTNSFANFRFKLEGCKVDITHGLKENPGRLSELSSNQEYYCVYEFSQPENKKAPIQSELFNYYPMSLSKRPV